MPSLLAEDLGSTPARCCQDIQGSVGMKKSQPRKIRKAMKKNIGHKIGKLLAAPFLLVGGLVALLVAYIEDEYDPYE